MVADEAIALVADPTTPISGLRAAARKAIGSVLGNMPEDPDRFRPHVSVAYVAADGPPRPHVDTVEAVTVPPAQVRIDHVDLIEMHRDHRMYEWTVRSALPLGGPVQESA